MKDGILYCSSRILDEQKLKAVGFLSESLDLESFTGLKFNVPLVRSKYSPMAISIGMHMHYNVCEHKGAESVYRLSLQHARIIHGRQLFTEIQNDCLFCKKVRLKLSKQIMGCLDEKQISISPLFYFTPARPCIVNLQK